LLGEVGEREIDSGGGGVERGFYFPEEAKS